jgi:hypothetical protein
MRGQVRSVARRIGDLEDAMARRNQRPASGTVWPLLHPPAPGGAPGRLGRGGPGPPPSGPFVRPSVALAGPLPSAGILSETVLTKLRLATPPGRRPSRVVSPFQDRQAGGGGGGCRGPVNDSGLQSGPGSWPGGLSAIVPRPWWRGLPLPALAGRSAAYREVPMGRIASGHGGRGAGGW